MQNFVSYLFMLHDAAPYAYFLIFTNGIGAVCWYVSSKQMSPNVLEIRNQAKRGDTAARYAWYSWIFWVAVTVVLAGLYFVYGRS